MISKRVSILQPSLTLKISAKAKSMKKSGVSVVDFSVGEPDFPTLESAKNAAKLAIDNNFTKYTQSDGIPELKDAILSQFKSLDKLAYLPNELIVSPGAKASIYLALATLINDGHEVIIPSPYWVSYPEQVRMLGGVPVFIEAKEKDNFLLTPEQLKQRVTPRTKVLILNNPSNPTGAVYPPEELKALAEMAVHNGIYIIADEVYSKIIYDDFKFIRVAALSPQIKEMTVTIDGASKAYSMTGWRIGFAAGPQKIIEGMKSIQDHLTSNPCSISQMAALEAYRGPQAEVIERARIFEQRRDFLYEHLTSIPGITCPKPHGAFYLFPNVSEYFNTSDGHIVIKTAMGLADYLLEKGHVAVVPGEGFGSPNNIRFSFATSMEEIREGIRRVSETLGKLGKI